MDSNMEAELLFRKREGLSETAFVEMVIWRVPDPMRGSGHGFKYRLALVADGVACCATTTRLGKAITSMLANARWPTTSPTWRPYKRTFGRTLKHGGQNNENGNARRVLNRGNPTSGDRCLSR